MCFVNKKNALLRKNKSSQKNLRVGIAYKVGGRIQGDREIEKNNFDRSKTRMSLDYIFEKGVSKNMDFSKMKFVHSRKTGRIKQIEDEDSGKVLFSFRPNGTIAPTVLGASLLLDAKQNHNSRFVVTVLDGVSEIVSRGETVFCKHVVSCDDSLRAGEDVVILNESGKLLAVGRSVVNGQAMKQFKRGQAVKVREGAE